MKDYLYKEIFNYVYNLYTEKNANDLLNENLLSSENKEYYCGNNGEKVKKKQKAKKRKKTDKKTLIENKKSDSNDEKDCVFQLDDISLKFNEKNKEKQPFLPYNRRY